MHDLRIEVLRGPLVESVHRVSLAVVDAEVTLRARSGNPGLVTFWRSAAKPFQAMPLVEDGVLDRFGLGPDALALACASHSSEPVHLALTDRMLRAIGCSEEDLACGTHPPLGTGVAREVELRGTRLTPRWSNCSGKHAGMLALARHHGWPVEGYQSMGHPVQDRILQVISHWTGMPAESLVYGPDGCTAITFGLPLRAMAQAYARLGVAKAPAAETVREAMMEFPELVAGEGRFCTELMAALPKRILVKVGAGGVYCAALPGGGLGLALKIEDGNLQAAPLALLRILGQLLAGDPALSDRPLSTELATRWGETPLLDTRGGRVGAIRASGRLRYSESDR